jgi:ribosomal protein S18 acetylase RimI-like enzyme
VEELTEADAVAVVRLWSEADLAPQGRDLGAEYRQALADGASTVLGLRQEGVVVATVMVGHDGHRGWVYFLAVAPAQRRRGLARRLLVAAEQWLAARGATRLQLLVRSDDRDAQGFYEHLGYPVQDFQVRGRAIV